MKKIEIELLTSDQTLEFGDPGFRRRKVVRGGHGGRADGGTPAMAPKADPGTLRGRPRLRLSPAGPSARSASSHW